MLRAGLKVVEEQTADEKKNCPKRCLENEDTNAYKHLWTLFNSVCFFLLLFINFIFQK